MNVALIGLGRMGQAMAGQIVAAGHELAVYNRTAGKAAALVAAGAREASSVADACTGREVVVTMVADDAALREVALGPAGIVASLEDGAVHVAMGTHGVATIRAVEEGHREAAQAMVAAPVLGRPEVAAQGQLGVVAAGPRDAVARCEPVFEAVGRRTFDAGERPEGASAVKLVNNFVLGCAIEAMAEAFSLVRKYGLEPEVMHDVMTAGLFAAPAYQVYGRIMVEEDYDTVGFTARLGLKDINLILAAADLANVPLPSANAFRDRLLGALAHGDGERDWAVVAREQARASGLE